MISEEAAAETDTDVGDVGGRCGCVDAGPGGGVGAGAGFGWGTGLKPGADAPQGCLGVQEEVSVAAGKARTRLLPQSPEPGRPIPSIASVDMVQAVQFQE